MGYMVRLGLWGTGTSFIDFRDFLGVVSAGKFYIEVNLFTICVSCLNDMIWMMNIHVRSF